MSQKFLIFIAILSFVLFQLNLSQSIQIEKIEFVEEYEANERVDARLDTENVDEIEKEQSADENEIETELIETSREEPARKRRKLSAVDDFDLQAVLEEAALGPTIQVNKAKKELCSISQSYLVEIIALHFLKNRNL